MPLGIWGRNLPTAAKEKEVFLLGDFCNFSIKKTYFYAYFGQNNYLTAITHKLEAFEK